jgi:hypothetical protein
MGTANKIKISARSMNIRLFGMAMVRKRREWTLSGNSGISWH